MTPRDSIFDPAGISYDPTSGTLSRNGREIGSHDRYRIVRDIHGNRASAHRVAWRIHHGEWPAGEVDHANGNKHDNRLANLRLATRSQNMSNAGPQANSGTGIRGVHWVKCARAWCVKVKAGAISVHQCASHKISAIVAARLIRRVLHGEFAAEARPTVQEVRP